VTRKPIFLPCACAAAIGLALLSGSGGPPAEAYLKLGTYASGKVVGMRWSAMPIRYFVNEQNLPGIGADEYRAAIGRAAASWQGISPAALSFQAAGSTSALPVDADGQTTLGFMARPDLDRVIGSTSFIVDTVTGEILEAGILFNSVFPWSVAAGGESGKYDVESIALHEMGHLAGLGHSALGETELRAAGRRVLASGAVMFPIAYPAGSTAGRQLRADDVAGMSDIYPGPAFRTDYGSISGRVTKNGRGVYGAHVVAFNPVSRDLVAGFTLDEQGSFSIAGMEAGSWIVRVEPLDDADVGAFFSSSAPVDAAFGIAYLDRLAVVPRGGNSGPFEIAVAAR
jgi:hypothetical protein